MSNTGENAELNGRDIYECANQLGGYVGPDTEDRLAQFLMRESQAAADLADEIVRLRAAETLLEEARRALAPFIRLADNVFSDGKNATVADEVTLWCFNDTDITFGDLRRARATLDRIGK
jgi:hypothetical protein